MVGSFCRSSRECALPLTCRALCVFVLRFLLPRRVQWALGASVGSRLSSIKAAASSVMARIDHVLEESALVKGFEEGEDEDGVTVARKSPDGNPVDPVKEVEVGGDLWQSGCW